VPTPAVSTDVSASITAPGPSGIPAARNARAKWTMFSAMRPLLLLIVLCFHTIVVGAIDFAHH
jgi:hypothetical protein